MKVVQRGDVGRALDGGVAAQGEDAAAGPADVAEQQLQDRRGADHLHAGRVLRPADGVADGAGAVRARRWPAARRRP